MTTAEITHYEPSPVAQRVTSMHGIIGNKCLLTFQYVSYADSLPFRAHLSDLEIHFDKSLTRITAVPSEVAEDFFMQDVAKGGQATSSRRWLAGGRITPINQSFAETPADSIPKE